MRRPFPAALALLPMAGLALLPARTANADAAANVAGASTTSIDGQVIYTQVCQGCHQANARGAIGAAAIPALAGNAKLQNAGYPVYVVLNGEGGMPWLGTMLNDVQIASVVSYVRTHFGNHWTDKVAAQDVAAIRGPDQITDK